MSTTPLRQGARNLLLGCARLQRGQRVLIVHEDPALGWHDLAAPAAVAGEAKTLGAQVTMWPVGAPGNGLDQALDAACAAHDLTVFFARCGDQDRFSEPRPGQLRVVCYARTAPMLASAFGQVAHEAMTDLKQLIDRQLQAGQRIRLTCPLGTDLTGPAPSRCDALAADVSVRRFPMGVPAPIDARGYEGRVALAHYLTPTGSRVYEPASIPIDGVVFVQIADGRIIDWQGEAAQVERLRGHMAMVARQFGLDADRVHSWHAGLHGGCDLPAAAHDDPDRWSNTVFMHPRFLHFHTCAGQSFGEVCWMVHDQTITIDDVPLWQRGRLVTAQSPALQAWRQRWPQVAAVVLDAQGATGLA